MTFGITITLPNGDHSVFKLRFDSDFQCACDEARTNGQHNPSHFAQSQMTERTKRTQPPTAQDNTTSKRDVHYRAHDIHPPNSLLNIFYNTAATERHLPNPKPCRVSSQPKPAIVILSGAFDHPVCDSDQTRTQQAGKPDLYSGIAYERQTDKREPASEGPRDWRNLPPCLFHTRGWQTRHVRNPNLSSRTN